MRNFTFLHRAFLTLWPITLLAAITAIAAGSTIAAWASFAGLRVLRTWCRSVRIAHRADGMGLVCNRDGCIPVRDIGAGTFVWTTIALWPTLTASFSLGLTALSGCRALALFGTLTTTAAASAIAFAALGIARRAVLLSLFGPGHLLTRTGRANACVHGNWFALGVKTLALTLCRAFTAATAFATTTTTATAFATSTTAAATVFATLAPAFTTRLVTADTVP